MKVDGSPSLAEKLERLFQTVHPAGRPPFSNAEVAAALQREGGPTVSATYLWQLRRGLRANPTKAHLEALARYFGVSPSYFFDESSSADIDGQLALLAVMRDARVRRSPFAPRGSPRRACRPSRGWWSMRAVWRSSPRRAATGRPGVVALRRAAARSAGAEPSRRRKP
jgi:transcriptional regulator with XRE-family HTH domain